MRVHIDGDLVSECSHILPERWNGWAQPVFTCEQKDFVVARMMELGWGQQMEKDSGLPLSSEWYDMGDDEWVTGGWIWLEVEEEGK